MSKRSWTIDSIGEPAFERLASGLTGSELQSLLLEVMQRRAAGRHPKDLLAQYLSDPFCALAKVDRTQISDPESRRHRLTLT